MFHGNGRENLLHKIINSNDLSLQKELSLKNSHLLKKICHKVCGEHFINNLFNDQLYYEGEFNIQTDQFSRVDA